MGIATFSCQYVQCAGENPFQMLQQEILIFLKQKFREHVN